MSANHLISWSLVVAFVTVGIALFFVRVDRENVAQRAHTNPGFALYRFRIFRYGTAFALIALAALMYFTNLT
jgi:hypothetical protein